MDIEIDVSEGIATITLNRPEVRNALSAELVARLGDAVVGLDKDAAVAAMILTGADPAFCAGFDLRRLSTELRSLQQERQSERALHLGLLPDHETPIIGAVNGAAVTGGLELALACDFLIASDRARFADTHARVGAMPGGGLTIRLPQLVGINRARQMSFTGDFVDAARAYEWGLVNEVVAHTELLARARELALAISSIPVAHVREVRRMYTESGALSGEDAWREEMRRSREWMAGQFDQARLAREREAIIERGAQPGVKVYAGMDPALPVREIIAHARRVEALGYDGIHIAETVHDALAISLIVSEHTERVVIRTSVALAFARSPTLTAYAAWDLAKFSGGRFQLGLGTQIRQNIEDRYGMPWSEPIERMRDYVGALDALFRCFAEGAPLRFEGAFYRLTRMQPYFNPGPDPGTAPPPIWLGGVNARVCQLAGELADGFVTHPTNSDPRYLRSVCLPNLRLGAERGKRDLSAFELVVGAQLITAPSASGLAAERERQRRLFAFLYSTPAYRRTLELYGWEDMARRLQAMVRDQRWGDLGSVVTDEVLDTLVPASTFDELPSLVAHRFGDIGVGDLRQGGLGRGALGLGVLIPPPADAGHDGRFAEVVKAIQAG